MPPRAELDAWATFVAVAEAGSFTRAARTLGVSVPTVSKTVAKLERRLGTALFQRTSRRLALSSSGAEVLARAADLVAGFAAMEDEVRDAGGPPRGLVRISAPVSFAVLHLAGPLTSFMAQWPDIRVDLTLSDARTDIVGAGIDLALRIGSLEDSSLRARRLCAIRRPLVAAPAYLQRRGTPAKPEDLKAHDAIVYSQVAEPARWTLVHDLQGRRQIDVTPRLTVDNGDIGTAALLAGIGIAVQPEFFIWRQLQEGQLTEVLRPWSTPPLGAYLLMPPSRLQPRRVRLLVEHLVAAFDEVPWAL